MRRVCLKPRAELDILEHEEYLFHESPHAADRFMLAVERTAIMISERPGVGSTRHFQSPAAQGVRAWPVEGFNAYLVLYREIADGVEVLRVLHAAQDVTQPWGQLDSSK